MMEVPDDATFQAWYWDREEVAGASRGDILADPTIRMVAAMREWIDAGTRS